jgi:hypothetical protein
MARKNKRAEELLAELKEKPPVASLSSDTVDTVSLRVPTVSREPGFGSGIYYDENAATPEMLEQMALMIRHKRSEADTRSESLKINKQGIFWTRVR